jgi:hypothetical protein
LVLVNQTLGELCTHEERMKTVDALWELVSPGGVLVITERGSRWGFSVIQAAREALISSEQERQAVDSQPSSSKMAVIGPCPHSGKVICTERVRCSRYLALTLLDCCVQCPMVGTQWCHFAQTGHRLKILQTSHKRSTNTPAIATARYSYVTFHKPQDSAALLLHPPSRRVSPAGTHQGCVWKLLLQCFPVFRHFSRYFSLSADAASVDDLVNESMSWIAGRFVAVDAASSDIGLTPRSLSSEAIQAAFHRAFSFPGDDSSDNTVGVKVEADAVSDLSEGEEELTDKYRDSEGSDSDSDDRTLEAKRHAEDQAQERREALREEISKAFADKLPGAGEWSRIVR